MLLPSDLRDWVADDHLVHFVIAAVEQLDVSAARTNERGSGSLQYPPGMMLALLVYSSAPGVFARRRETRTPRSHRGAVGAARRSPRRQRTLRFWATGPTAQPPPRAAPATACASKPSNRSSASSRNSADSGGFFGAAGKKGRWSGPWGPSPPTANDSPRWGQGSNRPEAAAALSAVGTDQQPDVFQNELRALGPRVQFPPLPNGASHLGLAAWRTKSDKLLVLLR
jgi:hypothetical protein